MRLSIGLLISGELGLISCIDLYNTSNCRIQFVLTNLGSKEIIEFCKLKNIPCFVGNPRNKKTEVIKFLYRKHVEYVISVNYLFIVGNEVLNHPKNHSINIHGSLLPKYRGRSPHIWSIINGENETGITAHIMNEQCDSGDIITQMIIPMDLEHTGGDILERFKIEYPKLLNNVLTDIENNKLTFNTQDHSKATYFGKRSPDDGEINWNWQKDRIRNWIRAQAYPYPGAFTYYNGERIIIEKISISELGYSFDTPNGTIIYKDSKPYVKTPNGVICIEKTREIAAELEVNKRFESIGIRND